MCIILGHGLTVIQNGTAMNCFIIQTNDVITGNEEI